MAWQAIEAPTYAVSEVVRYLGDMLEADVTLQDIWVRGEVSNYKAYPSGHWYFTLKDEQAALRCTMFRQAARFAPNIRDGSQILARGCVSVYEQRGELQLQVSQIQDIGVGLLYQQFLQMKAYVEQQGWAASERKRPLPDAPRVVGVVTSDQAAALRDIVRTLRLRWPLARVILAPAQVQGDEAPAQIAAAIRALNAHGEAEVIIVARGGGSIEDLWAFNAKDVAHAIAFSQIPVVTGVGHETDVTIADLVADLRAATPTAAAAAASPDLREIRLAVLAMGDRLAELVQGQIILRRDDLAEVARRLEREHPREPIARASQQIDQARAALAQVWRHRLQMERERLQSVALQLQALSPLLTIARGYATVTRDHDRAAVSSIHDVQPLDGIAIRLSDGTLGATVTSKLPAPAQQSDG
jgi:exodeoxyribonuclease VII large subunit